MRPMNPLSKREARASRRMGAAATLVVLGAAALCIAGDGGIAQVSTPMVVFGYNDLGMHCMNADFSEMVILPPFNTLHAQVISRSGEEPDIVTSGITVSYSIPGNTHSADKTNFWKYWPAAFGPARPANVGLTGNRLAGTMSRTSSNDWAVTGIPITSIDDQGRENPYQLALITVRRNGNVVARTQTVVPVSTEMNCQHCHFEPGVSVATNILRHHDELHGTTLLSQKPVVCAACHADNALGTTGQPGVPNLSSAMHTAHADRIPGGTSGSDACYLCHPGVRTQCQRDVHSANGVSCVDCHGGMAAVGNPARRPWLDEPRCSTCHFRPGFQFEQPGTLYRESRGHKNVHCAACHGSPHAITPTLTATDNLQANMIQGHAGKIDTCTVCHSSGAPGPFFHAVDD